MIRFVRYQDFAPWPTPAMSKPGPGLHPHSKHCAVFRQANALGWYLYPPFDASVTWHGGSDFKVTTQDSLGEVLWRHVMGENIGRLSAWWCSKLEGVLQIDPGLIYLTNPGYKVLLTGLFNRFNSYHWTHSGLLDSDWFWVPSTINLQVLRKDKTFFLRRNEPIAQILVLSEHGSAARGAEAAELEDVGEARRMWLAYMAEKFGGPACDWGKHLPEPKPGIYYDWKMRMEKRRSTKEPCE